MIIILFSFNSGRSFVMHKDMQFINVKYISFPLSLSWARLKAECVVKECAFLQADAPLTNTMLGCDGDTLRAVILKKTTFFLVKSQLDYQ